ncbi:MAG: hypothetical protein BWY11_01204 [Firmicutes bacterium ADurb.Bin182]|nr:MAG: hypothetical protein BWY11_01204 [Firmicutes bacterium ADurb.Bin182]
MRSDKSEFTVWRDKLVSHKLPLWDELTDIGLYMDQVTGLLQKYLSVYLRDDADKLISPSMVNNYVKMGIIPPPVNKRYGKDHIASLIMICVLKQVLSISEIKSLITLKSRSREISEIYDEFCNEQRSACERMLALSGFSGDGDANGADMAFLAAILANAGKAISGKLIDIENQAEKLKLAEEESAEKANKKTKKP